MGEGETPTQAPLPEAAPSRDLISPRARGVMLRWLEGQSVEDIANRLHLTVERVQRVLKLRAVKAEITRLQQLTNDEWVKDRVASMAHEALDTVRAVMRGETTSELQYKAAKTVLDLTPALRPPKDGIGKEIGAGIGDAIINALARLDGRQSEIDVTPQEAPRSLRPEGNESDESA